ncbi:exosortase family protein XrtF [Flavobacterium sp. RHBU_24]|uniref:exosortase family protein XrtF n=1 Tax=Flavobacterium sp. RHBU_24 TaxID=3391185 RepID=UPI0039856293
MGIVSNNKSFFLFLGKFALAYIVLSALYMLYLTGYEEQVPVTDPITHSVAKQTAALVRFFGDEAHLTQHPREASDRFYVNQKYVARVVEGCNAVSVMILFAAFIVAFSNGFKRTALYIVAGIVVIHLLNILRIALISMGVFYYPQYTRFMHDILFPVFIYSVVFLLWVLWVLKFYKNGKKVTT